jgi:hypothetical protein
LVQRTTRPQTRLATEAFGPEQRVVGISSPQRHAYDHKATRTQHAPGFGHGERDRLVGHATKNAEREHYVDRLVGYRETGRVALNEIERS